MHARHWKSSYRLFTILGRIWDIIISRISFCSGFFSGFVRRLFIMSILLRILLRICSRICCLLRICSRIFVIMPRLLWTILRVCSRICFVMPKALRIFLGILTSLLAQSIIINYSSLLEQGIFAMFVKSIRWGGRLILSSQNWARALEDLLLPPDSPMLRRNPQLQAVSQRTGWSAGQVLLNRIQTNPRNPGQNPPEAKPVPGILARILLKIQSKPESSSKSRPESFPTERHKDRTESSPKS